MPAAAIRARAPLRLGLAGGGTDLSPYCDRYGGAVLNATIDLYVYAHLEPRDDGRIVLRSAELDIEESYAAAPVLDGGQQGLALHRAIYSRMVADYGGGAAFGFTLTTSTDVPPGSGLGASSALCVAMVAAFARMLGRELAPAALAHTAFLAERRDIGLAGGRQDQYAAAFGGINFLSFAAEDRVEVSAVTLDDGRLGELQASLLLCFTGKSRESDAIIRQQITAIDSDEARLASLHRLKDDAFAMRAAVTAGDIGAVAAILDRSWLAKKQTAEAISNPRIEQLYDLAKANGALAGKVSGAGGGGFLMFVVSPDKRFGLSEALTKAGGDCRPVSFSSRGATAWTAP